MLALMAASSLFDADHILFGGNPSSGGGPVGSACVGRDFEFPACGGGFEKSILLMYNGFWFRVVLTGRFEFPA